MYKLLARTFLALTGWSVHNDVPDEVDKFVIIAAPHTSNWDFPFTLAVAAVVDIKFYWAGKHTLFRWPFGGLMRRLGGISIDRRKSHNYVEQLGEAIRESDGMALAIAPEGTRSKRDHWKSGFYHIAREAGCPIVLGFIDFGRKQGGLGPVVDSSLPQHEVMEQIRRFYADKTGKNPEQFTSPRFREKREESSSTENIVCAPKIASR